MTTDTELLDWLQTECNGEFTFRRSRDPYVGSPTYGELDEWQLFTVPSQHVVGSSIRDAIAKAMAKVVA